MRDVLHTLEVAGLILLAAVLFTIALNWMGVRVTPVPQPHIVAPCAQEDYNELQGKK